MQTIFVMVKCELGRTYDVADAAAENSENISEVHSISGQYDLMLKCYLADGDDIGHFVTENIQKLAAVTTYGGTRLRAFLAGDPPRCCVTRHLRYVCHRKARPKYLALYDMNRATDRDRQAFLDRVGAEMAAF